MDHAEIRLRVRVIVVSTRAAVRSLAHGDPQATQVIERGQVLLDALEQRESELLGHESFAEARSELAALVDLTDRQSGAGRSRSQPWTSVPGRVSSSTTAKPRRS